MARWLVLFLAWTVALSGWAQLKYYAPDMRWDDQLNSYLGVANPQAAPTTVTLIGYGEDGAEIGRQEVELKPYGQGEWAANTLFENGTLSWAQVQADIAVGAYIRYVHKDGRRLSIAALNTIDGDEAFVSQAFPFEDIEASQVVVVNTNDKPGQAFVQPVLIKNGFQNAGKADEAVAIEGFGDPGSKAFLDYGSLYQKDKVDLIWDRIHAPNGSLVAMQHLGDFGAEQGQMASLALPRSTHRDMIIGPLDPNDELDRSTRFVLVNTFNTPLRATLTAYYPQDPTFLIEGGYTVTQTYELGPYEKRVFEFNNYEENGLPAHAHWYRVQPFEGGLLGYQVIADRQTKALAACESIYRPSSVVTLPYTPSTNDVSSYVSMINPSDKYVNANLGGFDKDGRLVAYRGVIGLAPYEKKNISLDELFGSRASRIAWTRAAVTTGELYAQALVKRRDGSDMAAYQGVPYLANHGRTFFANMDYFAPEDLESQGWEVLYLDGYDRRIFNNKQAGKAVVPTGISLGRDQFHYNHAFPRPGKFFMESQFQAREGFFYLGYEPLFGFHYGLLDPPVDDTAMFLSPYFEVDNYDENYLTYYMRLMQPDSTKDGSEYGLVYRVEGTNTFTWFGVNSDILKQPPVSLRDCYFEVYYRCEDVFITDWLPFQYKLPEEVKGKRIQVGLYYRQQPGDDPFSEVPQIFIDDISIEKKPLDRFNFFPVYGFGSFDINEVIEVTEETEE